MPEKCAVAFGGVPAGFPSVCRSASCWAAGWPPARSVWQLRRYFGPSPTHSPALYRPTHAGVSGGGGGGVFFFFFFFSLLGAQADRMADGGLRSDAVSKLGLQALRAERRCTTPPTTAGPMWSATCSRSRAPASSSTSRHAPTARLRCIPRPGGYDCDCDCDCDCDGDGDGDCAVTVLRLC